VIGALATLTNLTKISHWTIFHQDGQESAVTQISLYEAKTNLSGLVDRAAAGEEFVIAKNGKPLAKLVPLPVSDAPRKPAGALGVTYIAPDFDEPDSSIADLFEGRD
jgi:prevent-host-death family protein